MRRRATVALQDRRAVSLVMCLAAFTIGVSLITPGTAAAHRRTFRKPLLAPITGTTLRPHRACPERACEAIVLPRPERVRGGYALPGSKVLFAGAGPFGGLDPQELQSAYAIPPTLSAPQTVAVIDYGGYPAAESDLAFYREQFRLPACTKASGCFHKVNQAGVEAEYPKEEPGWDEEAALDVDMVSATCPQCHIMMVETNEAPNESVEETANYAASENTAARLGATEISNSLGIFENDESWCGPAHCTQFAADYDHPGVVTTAAAGDQGYEEVYFGLGFRSIGFPASVPDVIAVGGTALAKSSNARGWSEKVWNEPPATGGSVTEGQGTGSGCALYEPKPSWQTDTGCTHRTDDDVAAVGAGETPVSVYHGGWGLDGGTSASAPIVAGIEAHASEYVRSLGPQAYYEDPAAMNDITEGFDWNWEGHGTRPASECAPNEYLCNAETGYDGPSGMGSPDGVPQLSAPSESHWYSNGTRIAEGVAISVKASGSITFHLGGSVSVTCKVKDVNAIENPDGGGIDTVSALTLKGCKATGIVCAKGEKLEVVAAGLPWSSALVGGSPIRDRVAGVDVKIECKPKTGPSKSYDTLTGALQLEVGTNLLSYGAGAGELTQSRGGGATVSGEEKLVAAKKAKITAATP